MQFLRLGKEGIAMETIPMKTMIPSTSLIHNHAFKKTTRIASTRRRRNSTQYKNLRFSIHAKFSDTNFQGNPLHYFFINLLKILTFYV
jgi:hypothetical protein